MTITMTNGTSEHSYYHVCWIDTGRKVYVGRSIDKAAEALVPGTVYGAGATKYDAWLRADKMRRKAIARNHGVNHEPGKAV